MSVLIHGKNVPPCTFLPARFALRKSCFCVEPPPSSSKIYIRVYFGLQVCLANLLLRGTSGIRAASAKPTLLQIDDADARSLAEIKRMRICDTLSGGTDAAGLNRSDISALPKFAMKSVHGRTLFMMRRSRCPACPALLQIGGADARSLVEIKRRRTFCTSSIYFGVATTQMPRIFAKAILSRLEEPPAASPAAR